MATASEADPTLPPGYVVSFIPFHERGFGVPASRFMRALLHYYSLSFSKRRQGLAGLAPTKALKTKPASVAGAAARHASWSASAQGALRRGGPRRHELPRGKPPRLTPPVGAAITPEEAADAAAALSPPNLLPTPSSTPVGAVADSPAKPPVAADVGMVEAPPPVVIPDLLVLGHEERAAVVAEDGDRKPVTLSEERPSTSTAVVPDASAAGGPDASMEGHVEPRPVLGSSGLTPAQLNPNEWCGQPLRFWGRGTSEPLLFLNDELEEKSWDSFREYTEAAMRSLRSTMEILSRDVPSVFQVRI
jgi:hypothetical protein